MSSMHAFMSLIHVQMHLRLDESVTTASLASAGKGNKGQAHQNQLYFHDVIICGSPIHQPDCAFIRELKQSGITLQYESQSLMSPPPYIDKVFVVGMVPVA